MPESRKRRNRAPDKPTHAMTPDELMARILRCPLSNVREAELTFDAARQYAETQPSTSLAGLIGRSLDVGDHASAFGAAYVAWRRGDSGGMVAYGTRRPDALPLIERWSVLVYGPEQVA